MRGGVRIDLPPAWFWWDRDDPEGSTVRDLDARIGQRPELAPARDTMLQVLLKFWSEANDQGAVAAGGLAEPAPDVALIASIVVVAVERMHPEDDEAELAAVVELLEPASRFDIRRRTVAVVDLPAGRSVRLARLARTDCAGPGQSEVAVDMVQHWLPVAGQPTLLVLAGSTPCLHAADELEATFDSIARSVVFESVPR
jgi:hypothetical protein